MIITKLIGGLGNQLFQYAAGRALSINNGCELLLDVSTFDDYKLHQGYQLEKIFSSDFRIATKSDIRKIAGSPNTVKMKNIIHRVFKYSSLNGIVFEPEFKYWDQFFIVQDESYLSGYWQSEKYFIDYEDDIRNDLNFRTTLDDLNLEYSNKLKKSSASVSIHIRRGDYLKNPKAMATHGVLSMKYYESAIKYIESIISAPHYYIFSDDIGWVKSNLSITGICTFVSHNFGENSYLDMMLMSRCKHHIIANSSFSWWAAWLNPSKHKIVIAPKNWFASNINDSDLIPSSWVRI